MSDDLYDNLPDDNELAFVELESHFRQQLESDIGNSDQGAEIAYMKLQYINQIVASAKALSIEPIAAYEVPVNENDIWDFHKEFSTDVMNLTIQISINHSRRKRKFSVPLSGPEKQKIRHYIEQIRLLVEESDYSQDKKDSVFNKLSELTLEIDRDRTRFEIIADGIRSIARLSGDVEREGAEPWWKWVKLIFGVVDEAKENEKSLPAPEKRKKLEPPRKRIAAPKPTRDLDDEIPF